MSYYIAQDGRIFRDNKDGSRTWSDGMFWERWAEPDLNRPLVHLHQNLSYFMTSDQIPVFCSPFNWDEINDVRANSAQWVRRVIGRAVQWAQNQSRTFIVTNGQVERYRIFWNQNGYQVFYYIDNKPAELALRNPRYTSLPRSSNANDPIFFETGFLYDVVGSSDYREIFIPAIPTPAFITHHDQLAPLGVCMNDPMSADAVNPNNLELIYQSLDGQIFKISRDNLYLYRLSEGGVWERTGVRYEQEFANRFWGTAEKQTVMFPEVWSLHYNETTADWSIGAGPYKAQKNFFQVAGPEFKPLVERDHAKILRHGETKPGQEPVKASGNPQRAQATVKGTSRIAGVNSAAGQDLTEAVKLPGHNAGNLAAEREGQTETKSKGASAPVKVEERKPSTTQGQPIQVPENPELTKLKKALELAKNTASRVDHWWLFGKAKAKKIREASAQIADYTSLNPNLKGTTASKLIHDQGLDSAMGMHRWKFFTKPGEKAKSLQELEKVVPGLTTGPKN